MSMSDQPEFTSDEDNQPPYFGIHHAIPIKHGSLDASVFDVASLPSVNVEAARRPITPGMPPLKHIPLPPPDAFRPVAPHFMGDTAGQSSIAAGASVAHPSFSPGERIHFPVAEPPAFKHLKSAPTVVEQPTIAAPQPTSIPASPPTLRVEPSLTPAEPSVFEQFEPLYALLIYLALGLGTWVIGDLETRYTILWTLLILMGVGLVMVEASKPPSRIALGNLAWGIVFGFPVGLLLLVFAPQALSATSAMLFPDVSLPALFQMLVLTGPVGETFFFRGVLQERRGIAASIIGAGLGTLILYLPAGVGTSGLVAVISVSLFMTVLSGVYSYLRETHGLAAAFVCQMTLNVLLLFLPRLLVPPVP
jgi:hypothetical protein